MKNREWRKKTLEMKTRGDSLYSDADIKRCESLVKFREGTTPATLGNELKRLEFGLLCGLEREMALDPRRK
jgi:hypothetical protein